MGFYVNKDKLVNVGSVMDLIGNSIGNGTRQVLLDSYDLPAQFFNLRTGFAGEYIQKFINYNIKAAIVLEQNKLDSDRFREMVLESNKLGNISYFENKERAVVWLEAV